MVLKRTIGGEKIANSLQRMYSLFECSSSEYEVPKNEFKMSTLTPMGQLLDFSRMQELISAGFHSSKGWRFVMHKTAENGFILTFNNSTNPSVKDKPYTHILIISRMFIDL